MKIRDAIQQAAEAVLSELLVPNAAKELARRIGERAEKHVINTLTGDDAPAQRRKPRTKAKAPTKKLKAAPKAAATPSTAPATAPKGRRKVKSANAATMPETDEPVSATVVPINGAASQTPPPVQTTGEATGLF